MARAFGRLGFGAGRGFGGAGALRTARGDAFGPPPTALGPRLPPPWPPMADAIADWGFGADCDGCGAR